MDHLFEYNEGYDAGEAGKEFDCPYETKKEIMQWVVGWKDGRRIYERRVGKLHAALTDKTSAVNDGTHKQAIVMRKDIKMPPGKAIAQGAHASLSAVWSVDDTDPRLLPWKNGRFTKTALKVDSEEELMAIYEAAKAAGLITSLIQDSGFTVFNGVPTYTAVSVGPDTIENVDSICGEKGPLGRLKLY